MQWREDVAPARAGDAAARERLGEYFTPFAHGVALAHAPHHVVNALVPRILERALGSLGGVADEAVGGHVVVLARKLAKEASPGAVVEAPSSQPNLHEARQLVARLRTVPELPRERLFLRLVEGVPGPELAQVLRVPEPELRAELERAATEGARALSQSLTFAGDGYLWELDGVPTPFLAGLEMQLPVLRYEPGAAPELGADDGVVPTRTSAPRPSASKPAMFSEPEGTLTNLSPVAPPARAEVQTKVHQPVPSGSSPGHKAPPLPAPGIPSGSSPGHKAPPLPTTTNPFETQAPTIAASDLPAEARGTLPAPSSTSSSGNRFAELPAVPSRPVPAVSPEGERSGKSNSNKSGRSGRTTRPEPTAEPKRISSSEPTKEGPRLGDEVEAAPTQAKVPAPLLARQQADVVTAPEGVDPSVLNMPTMQMPLGAAVSSPKPPAQEQIETRFELPAVAPVPPPAPSLARGPSLTGVQPLFLALILAAVGLAIYSASLMLLERDARSSWRLAQVVVAAEDMAIGEVITLENVALRAVPDTFQGAGVVKAESMEFIIDQKLAVAVQMGDPIFFSQLVALRKAEQRMATKVQPRTRGFTFGANAVQAVGRWVRPGDLVDIVVTFPVKKGENTERRAVTLLQKVPVLATGKIADTLTEVTLDPRERAWSDVTVLLTPLEVEQLHLATQLGNVRLTLRNEEDLEEDRGLDKAYSDWSTIITGEQRKLAQRRMQATVQIIRGAGSEAAPAQAAPAPSPAPEPAPVKAPPKRQAPPRRGGKR